VYDVEILKPTAKQIATSYPNIYILLKAGGIPAPAAAAPASMLAAVATTTAETSQTTAFGCLPAWRESAAHYPPKVGR
jgi:hypothetical protein